MLNFVKVLLYSYPHLESIIGDMDKLVSLKAYTSYGTSCEKAMEKIIQTMDKKNRLIDLKIALDDLYIGLSLEEKWLLEQKYFRRRKEIKKILKNIRFNFSVRTYFRKQNKLLSKLSSILTFKGMDEVWFTKNYSDIDWIFYFYKRIKNKAEKKTLKAG